MQFPAIFHLAGRQNTLKWIQDKVCSNLWSNKKSLYSPQALFNDKITGILRKTPDTELVKQGRREESLEAFDIFNLEIFD
jgi:hypothetical protein